MSNTRKGVACLDAWTTTSGEIADLDLDDVLLGCKDDIGVVVHRWILDVRNLGKLPAISSNDAQLDDHKDVHFRHLSVLLLSVLQNQIANSRFPPRSFLTFSTTISCPLFFLSFFYFEKANPWFYENYVLPFLPKAWAGSLRIMTDLLWCSVTLVLL